MLKPITRTEKTPSGRLIQKTQRQESSSVKNPPSVGPMMALTPKTLAKRPMYFPRSRGGKRSPEITMVLAIRTPAPSPWTARKAMSCAMLSAKPLSVEPSRKTVRPPSRKGLRPYTSESRPAMGTAISEVSKKLVVIQAMR